MITFALSFLAGVIVAFVSLAFGYRYGLRAGIRESSNQEYTFQKATMVKKPKKTPDSGPIKPLTHIERLAEDDPEIRRFKELVK
jgi:hypothetical protein